MYYSNNIIDTSPKKIQKMQLFTRCVNKLHVEYPIVYSIFKYSKYLNTLIRMVNFLILRVNIIFKQHLFILIK